MAENTIRTGLEFVVGGNAGEAMQRLQGAASGLAGRVQNVTRSFLGMTAGAVGLGYGLHAIVHQVVETNLELENTQKRITGTLFAFQSWRQGVTPIQAVTQSMANASEVTAKLEEAEERLALNLPDMAAGYNLLAGPVLGRLGRGREELLKLTEQASEAAVVFQQQPQQIAQAMARILETGRLPERSVDPFVVHMRQAIGKVKGLTREQLFSRMERELKNLGPVAERMSTGFAASWFRLKDFVGDTVRDLGSPVFKHVAETAERFRKILQQSVGDGKTLGQVYGERVLKGLQAMEAAASKILSYWKEIAIVWGAVKVSQGLGAAGMALGGMGMSGVGGALSGFASKLSTAALGLGALYLAASEFSSWVDSQTFEKRMSSKEGRAPEVTTAASMLARGNLLGAQKVAQSLGLGGANNRVSPSALVPYLERLKPGELAEVARVAGVAATEKVQGRYGSFEVSRLPAVAAALAPKFGQLPLSDKGIYGPELPPQELAKKGKQINNFYGGIHVNQDFQDQDPDRVFVRFKEDLEKQADRRLQPAGADPFAM